MQESIDKMEQENNCGYGTIKIADDVIATIVGIAAMEVEGVSGMAGGVTAGFSEILGKKNLTKGVKVDVNAKDVSIELYLVVAFGVKIPALAHEIQNKVRVAVESMTGLIVQEVNVHVQGVTFGAIEEVAKESKSELEESKQEKLQKNL